MSKLSGKKLSNKDQMVHFEVKFQVFLYLSCLFYMKTLRFRLHERHSPGLKSGCLVAFPMAIGDTVSQEHKEIIITAIHAALKPDLRLQAVLCHWKDFQDHR
jgi:hypothetical protein